MLIYATGACSYMFKNTSGRQLALPTFKVGIFLLRNSTLTLFRMTSSHWTLLGDPVERVTCRE